MKYSRRSFDVMSVFVNQRECYRQVKRRLSGFQFLMKSDAVCTRRSIIVCHCTHISIPTAVKPLPLKLLKRYAGNLLKALEKLVCCCIAIMIAGEIQRLAPMETVTAYNQPEHPDHFRGLYICNTVNQLIRVVKSLPYNAACMARILNCQRSERGVADAVNLEEAHKRRVKSISYKLPLHINGISFVKPDIKRRIHGSLAAALIVLELVNDNRVGIQQACVQSMLIDERSICNNRSIAGILHSAEIRFIHTDCPVGVSCIFIMLSPLYPEDRSLEYFHGNAYIFNSSRRNKILKPDGAA